MSDLTLQQAFDNLYEWCRKRDFAGSDPFDGLNSRVFQSTPFRNSRAARLAWTQALKRAPSILRPLALIPEQKNAKGIALFSLAALANHRRRQTAETGSAARALLEELWQMRIQNYSGAAWGYNFDWQSRKFFAPQGTPMIVPTAFAARAFVEALKVFGQKEFLQRARSSCDFILQDLNRTVETPDEICFSYSPLDQTRIFNASLFAAETLAGVGTLTGETEFCDLASRAVRFGLRRQNEDGSWFYGEEREQQWIDNFHTAYVLGSLSRISKSYRMTDTDLNQALRRGYEFWRERFFLADGWSKYYHDSLYPADAHAAATAIVTLVDLRELDEGALTLAEAIANWTIRNLRDQRGFFYSQRRRFHTVHTSYMRWTQAWMLYALARLLEVNS